MSEGLRRLLPRLGFSALSVVCMVLCVADYDVWWLAFFAWVFLFAAIEGARPRAALFYGWLIGTFTVFWGFSWLAILLEKFAGFSVAASVPIVFLFAAYHGLIWGFAAMITRWLSARSKLPLFVLAPPAWVAMEAVLPNIFPIYMAQGWAWQPTWIQAAELGGVTMVSGIMVAINAGLYLTIRSLVTGKGLDRRAAAFTFAMLVAVPVYGTIRIGQVQAQMDAAPKLKMGVVQGNMSIKEMGHPRRKHRILREQRRVSAELQREGAQIVVWGETAYPNSRVFKRASVREPPPDHPWAIHDREFTIPVVFGAVTRDHTGKAPYPWNTAILLGEDRQIKGMYDKVYRLIFGEYIPLVDPEWYLDLIPSASHLEKGDGPGVLLFGDYRLGPFICYEDILPRFVRATANEGVHVFVNLTNDAWFGKTHEPAQHLGLAVFRAIEHRKGMVRAVNTGISVYIDPTGQAHNKTVVTDPDVDGPQDAVGFAVDVPMMDPEASTLYGLTGEAFNALCVAFVGFIGWRGRRRRDDEPEGQSESAEPAPESPAPDSEEQDGEPEHDAEDDEESED